MVTYFYKANEKIRLTPNKRTLYCNTINGLFKNFYKDLQDSRDDYIKIMKDIYPSLTGENEKLNKIPSLYEQYRTYISMLHRGCFPSYDAILDIEGLDRRSNDLAGTYKASIIYDWYLIDLMTNLDKCADDWIKKGEAAAYIYWKKVVKEIRRVVPVLSVSEDGTETEIKEERIVEPVETFAAVDVKHIDPFNLYFDKSNVDNWDECKKIYRSFIPIEEILSNTSYNLTAEEKKDLKDYVYSNSENSENIYQDEIDSDTKLIGTCVEVLEFEGNFFDSENKEVYKRIEATVIAGKYLAKFEESAKPSSSIVWGAYMVRPDSGRGQAPMCIPSILNTVQNACADLTMTAWQLTTYPTFLAPKGAFNRYQEVIPGKPIEYDSTVLGEAPYKLDFSQGYHGFEFSDFFQRKMENATGINQYMQGSTDATVRTAAESSFIHSGATMRVSYETHLFSQYFLFPLVRKYALFKKVYDTKDLEIPIGENKYALVDAEVRNGNYRFIIGGSQSAVEREAETNKLFQLLGLPVVQSVLGLVDPYTASEFLKWVLNRSNFKATDQVMSMLSLNGQLAKLAKQLGIQDKNIQGFRDTMMRTIEGNLPNIATGVINEIRRTEQ